MKINKKALETSLKMTSNIGIYTFIVFGVVGYLVVFLAATLTRSDTIDTWKILVGSIGGAIC